MLQTDIEKYFLQIIDDDNNMSNGIAAIKTLLLVLERTNCEFHHLIYFLLILNLFNHFSHNNSGAGEHNQVGCQYTEGQWEANNLGLLRLWTLHLFHYFGQSKTGRQNDGWGENYNAESRKCVLKETSRKSSCHRKTCNAIHHRWMRKLLIDLQRQNCCLYTSMLF